MEADNNIRKTLLNAKDQALEAVAHAKDVSIEKVREVSRDVDNNVHQNPWPYLAGTAVVGLLLGYVLGRNRK